MYIDVYEYRHTNMYIYSVLHTEMYTHTRARNKCYKPTFKQFDYDKIILYHIYTNAHTQFLSSPSKMFLAWFLYAKTKTLLPTKFANGKSP